MTQLPGTAVRRARLIGIAALIAVAALSSLGQNRDGGPFATFVFDLYQLLAPRDLVNHHVRIVSIDEASIAEVGPWPWPRHYLAAMVEAAHRHGATAIGFDMVFPEADRHGATRLQQIYGHLPDEITQHLAKLPEPDHYFAHHLSRAGSVMGRIGTAAEGNVEAPESLPLNAWIEGSPEGLRHYEGAVANIEALDSVAKGHGLLNGAPDPDGIVRRVPLMGSIAGELTPGFALELLRVSEDIEDIERLSGGREIRMGPYTIRTDDDADMRLHFAPFTVDDHISASDLLNDRVDSDALSGRIVIVAAGAVGLGDVVATPQDGEVFGVDLHAQAISAIKEGTWLERPVWGLTVEWLLFAALGLAALLTVPALRFGLSGPIVIGVSFLVVAISWLLFHEARLLVDPAQPLLGLGSASLALYTTMFVEAERHQRTLQAALTEARVEQARISGELSAARDIQLGILPDATKISSLPEGVEAAALLEPAREIGGDLYDIFMLDERRLYFMVGDVTGKGVPAALFMSISKVLTKSAVVHETKTLADAMMRANNDISRDNPADLFVTALAGILDCETGELVLVNAGHDDPIILGREADPVVLKCDGGPPLCVMDDFPYDTEHFQLAPGETMVIITDGVTEAKNAEGALYGGDRLSTLLEEAASATPGEIIDTVKASVRVFEGDAIATDDLTVMAITRKG